MTDAPEQIGHVLRASTSGFDFGTRGNHINEQHSFGSFVFTQVAGDGVPCFAIGLIYAIRISDDPFVRELVMAEALDPSALMDQRQNRLIPIETMVLNVGYSFADGTIVHSMPPRPPLSLTPVYLLDREMVLTFVQRTDFFRIVLNAGEVPSDDLLAASIRHCGMFYTSETDKARFLVRCGQQVARLLTNDLRRVQHIINLIRG